MVNRFRLQRINGTGPEEGPLFRAIRAHSNFVEYTPFTFLLLFLAELNGAPTSWVHVAFTTLFFARVAHCSFGLYKGVGSLRKAGFLTTAVVMIGAALYNVRLG